MKKRLKLTAILGVAVLMIPLGANAQEHGQVQAKQRRRRVQHPQ